MSGEPRSTDLAQQQHHRLCAEKSEPTHGSPLGDLMGSTMRLRLIHLGWLLLGRSLLCLDVVIPCDLAQGPALASCITSLYLHMRDLSRILVISPQPLTDQAEWVDEARFPFHRTDLPQWVPFLTNHDRRRAALTTWPLQRQLLKLCVGLVVPDLSDPYLAVDPSVILLQPLPWVHEDGSPWQYVEQRYHMPFYAHLNRLVPGLRRIIPGSAHPSVQVIDRAVVEQLQAEVQAVHHAPLWQAIVARIDPFQWAKGGCSIPDLLANYRQRMGKPSHYGELCWSEVTSDQEMEAARQRGDGLVVRRTNSPPTRQATAIDSQ